MNLQVITCSNEKKLALYWHYINSKFGFDLFNILGVMLEVRDVCNLFTRPIVICIIALLRFPGLCHRFCNCHRPAASNLSLMVADNKYLVLSCHINYLSICDFNPESNRLFLSTEEFPGAQKLVYA